MFEAGKRIGELARKGDIDAQFEMGQILFLPQYGVQNFEHAFSWYQKAAAQDHVEAMHMIGIMYSRGSYVKASQEKAVYWYRKSAERGSPGGQFDLAYRYQSGRGVEQDLEKAKYWYEKAAQLGHQKAAGNLKNLLARGMESAEPSGLMSLRNAAANGNAEAQWQLYRVFAKSRLERPDPEKASHWLLEAARNKHPKALQEVVRIGFFQGCQRGCLGKGEKASTCSENCQCVINRLEKRFSTSDIIGRIVAATQHNEIAALIELVEEAKRCGGIAM